MVSYVYHVNKELFPLSDIFWIILANIWWGHELSLGHEQLSRRRGATAGTGVERAHRTFSCRTAGEICRRWCEAFHHFVPLSCTEAACWNVSAESTQDSTCPGHCLAPLHNFVLPYGNLVICSQERKWFPFVLMTTIFSRQEQRTARDVGYKA